MAELKDEYRVTHTIDMDRKATDEIIKAIRKLFEMLGYRFIMIENFNRETNVLELELRLKKLEEKNDKT